MRIAAIDPSLTSTGLAYGTTANDVTVISVGSKPQGKTVAARISRAESLLSRLLRPLEDFQPEIILLEGYSHGSITSGATQNFIAEFGGCLRWNLTEYTDCIHEIAPTSLKKFATGKGNSPKDQIGAHVSRRWGRIFDNNDQTDAYVMFRMGLVMAGGVEAETQEQRDVLAKISS